MIRRVSANHDSFRQVEFGPDFNLVLAERTAAATDRDSRNGLGKSLLLDILHFCLGSKGTKGRGVAVDALTDWEFRTDLTYTDGDLAFSRAVSQKSWVRFDSDSRNLPVTPEIEANRQGFKVADQRLLLGRLLFGLTDEIESTRFGPSYRSLISYLMRRGPDGFLDPFLHDRNQQPGDKQVNVSYHLGLNWRDAAAFEGLRVDKRAIDQLTKAMKAGSIPSYLGSEGELEAERVRLGVEVDRHVETLARFEVREDYREIEAEVDKLTERAHQLVNENIRDRRFIDLYISRLDEEKEAVISGVEVDALFQEVQVELPEQVHRRLEEVHAFHDAVIENRQVYLTGEIDRLKAGVAGRDEEIATVDSRRSELLQVLESSGALEEYTRRQELLVELRGRLQDVEARLQRLREVTQARSDWEARRATVAAQSHVRYEELKDERDRAISHFNSNTEALYEAPGRLIIDITDKGFDFDVKIDRSESHGVSNMKIFCFDLMLMQLWAARSVGPGFLFHDSSIFDGVDSRQVAAALELADKEATRLGFQYICSLNSDDLPRSDLEDDSPVLEKVAIELRDDDPSGMLLGIEF
ncbi:MAG: DUF2326 domain-containing protein [Actinobacteria bacterium]|nr:DUF2326 domain-containing protein [Actinomycetota bacterium]